MDRTTFRNRTKFVTCSLLITLSCIHANIYIVDLGQTLMDVDPKAFFSGYSLKERLNGYCSALKLFLPFKLCHPYASGTDFLKTTALHALEQVPCASSVSYQIYSDDGVTPLPPLLTESLLGNIDYAQAKQLWYAQPHSDFCNKTFEFAFNPKRFVTGMRLIKPTVDLMQRCAQEKDEHGNKKHILILLSNFGAEAAREFEKQFKNSIMSFIDCTIFSGDYHCCKPDAQIYSVCYEKIQEYLKLFPEQKQQQIFFFDDQDVNCKVMDTYMRQKGLSVICAHPKDMSKVLIENNALPANVFQK